MHDRRQLERLMAGESLDAAETAASVGFLMDGVLTPEYAAAWLTALAVKGETVDEIVGAAEAMRARSLHVEHTRPVVIDVCGTGGDGRHTINISTAVAFVVAACGVPVAKHGNRAASSRCGSADVLEALGVPLDETPLHAGARLDDGGVAFLFAQQYHPAMKRVASLRKALGIRTVFNVLGPLTNPARATHQMIGVARPGMLALVGEAALRLGIRRVGVVHAASGLDEVAGDGPTTLMLSQGTTLEHITIDPADFGIHATLADLAGGDAEFNASAMQAILSGEGSPRADLIALNAALALFIAETAPDIAGGLQLARAALRNGSALAQLNRLQAKVQVSHE